MQQMSYTTIKVSKIDRNLTDNEIFREINEKCQGMRGFNVKVVHGLQNTRLAYINFYTHEQAFECYKSRRRSLETMRGRLVNVVPIVSKSARIRNEVVDSKDNEPSKRFSRSSADRNRERRDRSAERENRSAERRDRSADRRDRSAEKGERSREKQDRSRDLRSVLDVAHDKQVIEPRKKTTLVRESFAGSRLLKKKYYKRPTRTLYVGDLDDSTTKQDLQRIFEPYGFVEDIDIKVKNGVILAFVKYFNLDMAERALRELSGLRIGKKFVKLGFGNVSCTHCIWIGGVGPWTDEVQLMRTFGEYGDIERFEWPHGKDYAYVLYEEQHSSTKAFDSLQVNIDQCRHKLLNVT